MVSVSKFAVQVFFGFVEGDVHVSNEGILCIYIYISVMYQLNKESACFHSPSVVYFLGAHMCPSNPNAHGWGSPGVSSLPIWQFLSREWLSPWIRRLGFGASDPISSWCYRKHFYIFLWNPLKTIETQSDVGIYGIYMMLICWLCLTFRNPIWSHGP